MIPSNRFYLSLQSRRSESELGEGGFIVSLLVVAAVAQVAPFLRLSAWQLAAARRIHLENNRPVLPRWPFPFVENDTPDATVPFAPTLGDSLNSTILPFLDDGARHRIIVELNGGVGARVVVAGKPITGAFNIEPVRFAASLVDDAHIGLLTDHREPGDTSSFATLSQVDDMRDRAVIDVVSGDTRIFGMMHESRIVELTGTAGVDEMSGASRIGMVDSRAGVDYMLGDSRVGSVRGRVSMLRENSHVDSVNDGGFVEEVHDNASVKFVVARGRVKGVYENGYIDIVRRGGSVGSVNGEDAMVVTVGGGGTVERLRDGATIFEVGDYHAPDYVTATVGSVDESSKIGLIDCGADVTFDYPDEEGMTPERASVLLAERLRGDGTSVSTVCVQRMRDASLDDPNVTLRVRDGDGNVVEVSRVGDVLRGLPDVTSIERDEMRKMIEGSRA